MGIENRPVVRYIYIYFSVILLKSLQGEIHHVVNPDPYRGVFGSDSIRYAKDVQDHIDFGTSGKVAGFIAETVQVRVFRLSLLQEEPNSDLC